MTLERERVHFARQPVSYRSYCIESARPMDVLMNDHVTSRERCNSRIIRSSRGYSSWKRIIGRTQYIYDYVIFAVTRYSRSRARKLLPGSDNLWARYFRTLGLNVFPFRLDFFCLRIVDAALSRRRRRRGGLRAGNHLDLVLLIRAKATDRKYLHGCC